MQQDNHQTSFLDNIQGIKVVNLSGSWQEMGRQYGSLVKEELWDVYRFLCDKTANDEKKKAAVKEKARLLYSHYPQYLDEFMNGAAETSDLTKDQLIIVNAVEYAEPDFSCSGLAAWHEYASGNLLYGRNYDAVSFIELRNDIIITVFHPNDGSLATATVGYAGEIYAVNALNEKGIFIELNNGMPSAGSDVHFEMSSSTVELLNLALHAHNMDDVDDFFHQTQSFAAFIIGVANADTARAYEWCYDGVQRADVSTPDGLMAISNHYVNTSWPYPTPTDQTSWNSLTRRNHLLALAEQNKGCIDSPKIMTFMQTTIADGGPMCEFTRYQLVVEPATLTLWIQVTQRCKWVKIELTPYLR